MKPATLPLALTLSLATACAAQAQTSNVSVYGLIDGGVEYITNTNAAKDNLTRVTSGSMNTSRWGFRGSEDLGGGLKAIFNLEGAIQIDAGTSDGLFRRAATVGLEGSFGRVVLGRGFTTTYDFLAPFDPMGYSSSYSWILSGSATGVSKYGMATAFDNLIKYQGQVGKFKIGATLGMGEQANSFANSAKYVVGAAYADGALSAVTTFERVNGNTVAATGNRDETSTVHLAGAYDTGTYKVIGGARSYKLAAGRAATADLRANTYWTGLSYKAAPAVTLIGAIYYQDVRNVAAGTDADPVMYVARAKYALSKRTDLYSTLGYTKAKNGKLAGLSRDEAGFSDTQTGLAVGIQHRF